MITRIERFGPNYNDEAYREAIKRIAIVAPFMKWFYDEDENGNVTSDKLQEFKDLEQHFTSGFLNKLKTVVDNITAIEAIDEKKTEIINVSNYITDIKWAYENRTKLIEFKNKMNEFESKFTDAQIMTCRVVDFAQRANKYKLSIEAFYFNKIKPEIDKQELLVNKLENQLAASVALIDDGHKWAKQVANSVIRIKPTLTNIESVNCVNYIQPEFNPDGSLHKQGVIEFCVPRPICSVDMKDIPQSWIQNAVDEYINTLHIGGDSNDEAVSEDELNNGGN